MSAVVTHPFLLDLQSRLWAHANAEIAQGQAAYLKHHFVFLGIPKPQVMRLCRESRQAFPLTSESELMGLLKALWKMEAREFHYAALWLADQYQPLHTPAIMPVLTDMARTQQWWDSIDPLAADLIGGLVARYPALRESVIGWIEEDDFWMRRVALLFQLKYKTRTDAALLFSLCERVMDEKAFFIRKAIGWALREYAKTDPDAVWAFAQTHRHRLSGLSYREATRRIRDAFETDLP